MNASLISTVILVLFTIFVVLGIVFGYIRGLNKSLTRLIIVLVVAVLTYFIVQVISKTLLTLDISGLGLDIEGTKVTTVDSLITSLLNNIPYVQDLMTASPTLEAFIQLIPQMVVNVVLFVLLFTILRWISMIIYAIIAGVCFSKKKMKDKEKHSFIGAIIGAVQGVIITCMLFVPIFGILETAKPFLNSIDNSQSNPPVQQTVVYTAQEEEEDEGLELDGVVNEVKIYLNEFENNWIIKVLSTVGVNKLSVAMFDGLTTVEKNNVKISLRNETNVIAEVVPDVMKVMESMEGEEGFALNDEMIGNFENILDTLFKSTLISGVVNEVVPYAAQQWYNGGEYDGEFFGFKISDFDQKGQFDRITHKLIDQLKDKDTDTGTTIKEDLLSFVDMFNDLKDAGILDMFGGEGESEGGFDLNPEKISSLIENLGSNDMVKEIVQEACSKEALTEMLGGGEPLDQETEKIVNLVSETIVKVLDSPDLASDAKAVQEVFVLATNIMGDDESFAITEENSKAAIDALAKSSVLLDVIDEMSQDAGGSFVQQMISEVVDEGAKTEIASYINTLKFEKLDDDGNPIKDDQDQPVYDEVDEEVKDKLLALFGLGD